MNKGLIWNICFSVCLTAFTAYIALDTFVLSSAYQTNATEMNTAMFDNVSNTSAAESGSDTAATAESTSSADTDEDSEDSFLPPSGDFGGGHHSHGDSHHGRHDDEDDDSADSGSSGSSADSVTLENNSYSDGNITIEITEYYENDTKIYVADIKLSSAEYLKTAFADDTYGKNVVETTSEIASNHSAILAINGDYYGAQESGYVIRNGVVYRDKAGSSDVLCVYADGTMGIADPAEKTAQELVDEGVWQAFSFGPTLIESGTVTVTESDEVGKARASNPRTAIGIIDTCRYLFVVADGRTSESEGLSLLELAEFMQGLGATTAYNLDGGGSSTMYFNGEVINKPTTTGHSIEEREVSDIVYIG